MLHAVRDCHVKFLCRTAAVVSFLGVVNLLSKVVLYLIVLDSFAANDCWVGREIEDNFQ